MQSKYFSKNTYFFYSILIFLIAWSIQSYSVEKINGIPHIQNFRPMDYGYESQNFSIAQDSSGIMYFGNLSGVLKYDGNSWELIKLNGWPRLVSNEKGEIYVGAYDEFGKIITDSIGRKRYFSIIRSINFSDSLGQIEQIFAIGDNIVFSNKTRIYIWNGEKISEPKSFSGSFKIFKVRSEILVFIKGQGLFMIDSKEGLVAKNGRNKLKDLTITEIFEYPDGYGLYVNNRDFKVFQDGELYSLETEIAPLIKNSRVVSIKKLRDNVFAVATDNEGIYFFDEKGKLLSFVNNHTGLNDDKVHDLFIDTERNLWAALDNGISRIEFPSKFMYYNISTGLNGSVSGIIVFNNTLYVATSQGIFYMQDNHNIKNSFHIFKKIEGVIEECYDLHVLFGRLFFTSESGIYELVNNEAILKHSTSLTAISQSKLDSSLIYVLSLDGLFLVRLDGENFIDLGKVGKLSNPVRTIAETKDSIVWMGTNYNGIFRFDFNSVLNSSCTIERLQNQKGLPKEYRWVDVYNIEGAIIFSTSQGIYRYNIEKDWFYKDTIFYLENIASERWYFPIFSRDLSEIWFSSGVYDRFEKTTGFASFSESRKLTGVVTEPFATIRNFTIETIFVDDRYAWFGGDEGLIRYTKSNDEINDSVFFSLITKVIINKDSVISASSNYYSESNEANRVYKYPVIRHKYNTISFCFSTPFYINDGFYYYQFYLENFDKNWSDWQSVVTKEYTNLPAGDYVFHVRAKNLYGKAGTESEFRFSVLPPYYLTIWAFIIYALLLSSFITAIIRWRTYLFAKERLKLEKIITERTEELLEEKGRSEDILVNMLPKPVAEELKIKGKVTPKKFDSVTVFFSDIKGFTEIGERLEPDVLISKLDRFFHEFDKIVEKHKLEKIKTIGDAYMCAGGLPRRNKTHPISTVLVGLEIMAVFKRMQIETNLELEKKWNLRIGIHSGPVVAGVIGSSKLFYDIWGDTVNTASRLESAGTSGEVNISDSTYKLVKDYFICEYRGKIPVKDKGEIDMYYVKGLNPLLRLHENSIEPNRHFYSKIQYLVFDELYIDIIERLKNGLDKNLYYHNVKHTEDVVKNAEIIGKAEGLTESELLVLKTAALFHDFGFTIGYDQHEKLGTRLTQELLPEYHYSTKQIDEINRLIMATVFPPKPKDKLEQIMCDADLDYLGRKDFLDISKLLYMELYERKKIRSIDEWNDKQLKFIKQHQYFTKTAKESRDVQKEQQIRNLEGMIMLQRLGGRAKS